MANNILKINLKWRRPKSVKYPKVWLTFMGRDLDTDNLVEYRIEDVTESNAENVLKHMKAYFIHDEPISRALGCSNDELYYEDYKMVWDAVIDQKTPLVCYKAGSDEIVGAHMTLVESKADNYKQQLFDSCRSDHLKQKLELFKKLSCSFCPFQYYGVDEILTELGLSVSRKYRGRGIGAQMLATHKLLCKEYGLKVAHGSFTSEYSDACADKVGFVTNTAASYEDFLKNHPEYIWMQNIKVKQFSKRSLLI